MLPVLYKICRMEKRSKRERNAAGRKQPPLTVTACKVSKDCRHGTEDKPPANSRGYNSAAVNRMNGVTDIAILVDNSAGVLSRVSGMFTRRGFNIHSLTVSETEDPKFSRITIVAEGDEQERRQIMKQLKKLYVVKEVKNMARDASVKRELALIKLENNPASRAEIVSAVDIFRSKIIDYSPNTLCVEITGEPSKIDAFIKVVKPYTILEMARTGIVALDRGCRYLNPETTKFRKDFPEED